MPITYSPLRYPGGKSQLSKFVKNLMKINKLERSTYVEPFSGGAGISLNLLLNKAVDHVIINDFDPSIHAFWHSILYDTKKFIQLIETTPIDISNWIKQKEIYVDYRNDPFSIENGFATFYLNRTNRSGIISGGPIGGYSQQGKYKIDCRFNKKNLIKKIEHISSRQKDISLYNLDAQKLVEDIIGYLDHNSTFIFFDPPYYKQGKNLYTNFFEHEDHVKLKKCIDKLDNFYWIATYDYTKEIFGIYKMNESYEYSIQYTAQNKRKEKELLFCSLLTKIDSFEKIHVNKINCLTLN